MHQHHLGFARHVLLFAMWLALSLAPIKVSWAQPPKQLEVELQSVRYVGLPVHWGRSEAALLEANGRLQIFSMHELRRHQLLPLDYSPQPLADARQQLQAELGTRYETMIEGPYVIAAPAGQTQRWRERFNALFAGYVRYFEVRGWPLRKPDFPLCVIVFGSRQEFLGYVQSQRSGQLSGNVVGSYFPRSNRCVLYQLEGSRGTDWSETEATIVHEAVHQLAFNTGIHERLAQNPAWFVEGLATMFEHPAVYDLRRSQSTVAGRRLPAKVASLRPLLQDPPRLEQQLQRLIEGDQLFQQDPELAYAVGWGLTFYAAERMPLQFRDYYSRLSRRGWGSYPAGERVRDFRSAFGGDLGLLAIQLQRLMSD